MSVLKTQVFILQTAELGLIRIDFSPILIYVLHAQSPFLLSKVFALCQSEDRIRAISIKNGLVCGRAEVLANGNPLLDLGVTPCPIRIAQNSLEGFASCAAREFVHDHHGAGHADVWRLRAR